MDGVYNISPYDGGGGDGGGDVAGCFQIIFSIIFMVVVYYSVEKYFDCH